MSTPDRPTSNDTTRPDGRTESGPTIPTGSTITAPDPAHAESGTRTTDARTFGDRTFGGATNNDRATDDRTKDDRTKDDGAKHSRADGDQETDSTGPATPGSTTTGSTAVGSAATGPTSAPPATVGNGSVGTPVTTPAQRTASGLDTPDHTGQSTPTPTAPASTAAGATTPTSTAPTPTGSTPTGSTATGKPAGPGAAKPADQPKGAPEKVRLVATERADSYGTRWDEVKGMFVDEPREAVQKADALVGELLEELEKVFREQRRDIEKALDGDTASTEDLRLAFRRYRSFFDRLLSL